MQPVEIWFARDFRDEMEGRATGPPSQDMGLLHQAAHRIAVLVQIGRVVMRERMAVCVTLGADPLNAHADPAAPIHNNLAEQQMKRIALPRENALFAGSPRGGETAAVLSSLTSTPAPGRAAISTMTETSTSTTSICSSP